ncbi:MAG: hydroxymethylbilane synthase [Balneolaceae bacterium]
MNRPVRIGTRDSELAVWQAETVLNALEGTGVPGELIHVKSEGDLDLETPLSELGGKGVFTKALDEALLNGDIDIAVHSYKDLPTDQPLPLQVAAVLKRGDHRDSLVAPKGAGFLEDASAGAVVATGSNRRRAQWLHRFPNHKMADIRGNVHTRLRKVEENEWDGAIFAAAGLQRVGLEDRITEYLDWMVPAPAQGAVAVMVREEDRRIASVVRPLHDPETGLCTGIERELLNRMEAGCSAPVGAYAWLEKNLLILYAVALETDGSLQYDVELSEKPERAPGLGIRAAEALLEKGAGRLIESLR